MWADQAMAKLLADYSFETVLDIGSGPGEHRAAFERAGKTVSSIDVLPDDHPGHVVGDYMQRLFPSPFDCVWCSHVLEHQPNAGNFLRRVFFDTKIGGVVALTVPPRKDAIVGGHVSLWNAGLLLYNLILAGFDCSTAAVRTYGYNVSVIVEKRPITLPELAHDSGDIGRLRAFFPRFVDEGFCGVIPSINWE